MLHKLTPAEAAFAPPAEADWHRMISEAAYYIAERGGVGPGDPADDWRQAEDTIQSLVTQARALTTPHVDA